MRTKVAVIALGLLLLTGCTPTATTTSDRGDADSAGGDTTAPCFVGIWDLDVAHYQDDVSFFASETGVPLGSLTISGTQTLTFAADGQVTLGTDLTSDTTIPGMRDPLSSTSTNYGIGNWSAVEGGTLTITDFSFSESTVRTSDDAAPVFGGCDFTAVPTAEFECEGDSLFIIGPDAPYGSYWTRR